MVQPDTLLQNRYRVVQQVGKGGMGEIYLAIDERFQSRVAIKRAFFDDPEMCKAFRREAKLLNHLRHAALPKVSDHFSEGEDQFLVMEFIEGFDFAELLTRRKVPLPLSDVLRWADELLDALVYLHAQEPPVIHRDIKPPNIKLTPGGKVMLLDFGLAKGAPMPGQTASGTASSVFGFSMNFAPLEQMQGSGTDPRSDIYSLAATLYSLLTGIRPPDALARASATIRHQPDPLRPAHLVQPQVPAAVSQILHRAMSQNPALRQASAAELREELRLAAKVAVSLDSGVQARAASVLPQSVALPEMAGSVDSSTSLKEAQRSASQERPQIVSPAKSAHPSSLSSGDAATTIDSRRHPRFSDSETVVARAASPPGKTKVSRSFALAACSLVVCVAVVAYLLTRSSGPSLPNAETNVEVQSAAPSSQQIAPAEKTLPAADSVAADSAHAAPGSDVSAQSAPARTAGETPASNSQAAVEPASTPDPLMLNFKEGTASESASGVTTSSAGKPVLVIQNPTPAKKPADESRHVEEAKQEQPANRPEYARQPPPGPYPPPPDGWRPPPPDGRRPPPPFRPPNR
jgi:serine/threonine protein kinase